MVRPAVSLNTLFLNASPRPVVSSRTAPRLVENLLSGGNGVVFGYDRYYKGTGSSWGDNPTNTDQITWGYNVDGGQWFEVTTVQGGVNRVWASFTFTAQVGTTYLISANIDSKSGTNGNNGHILISSGTFTGGVTVVHNPAIGRVVLGGRCTSGGNITVRIGIGTNGANDFNATMRFSNVMLEIVPDGQVAPGDYVRPGDQQVFNYTSSATVTSGIVGTPTLGTPYAIPRRSSVLIIGDSWANDLPFEAGGDFGDFPWQVRRHLRGRKIAVNAYGVAGHTISQITAQIAAAVARQATTPSASRYTLCIAEGGTNDVAFGRTLAQMQADRLAQIAAILAAGMYPILMTTPPRNAASGAQQSVIDGYNAWIKTLGYPVYDLYADANDGNGDFKTAWDSADGVHIGVNLNEGADIMGQRLADIIMLVGD